MSFLGDLGRDLAERRLWPLAAVPPAALAVVVALGGGSEPAQPPAVTAPPEAAPAATVRELERLAGRRDRERPATAPPPAAAARDPFTGRRPDDRGPVARGPVQRRGGTARPRRTLTAAEIVRTAERAAQANARAVAAAVTPSAAPAPAPASAPAPVRAPRPAPPAAPVRVTEASPTVQVADIRLSDDGRVARARRNVPALTPLPSVRGAAIVVRHIEPDVVEFALRPGATVRGGRCLPARDLCHRLRVAAGRTARIALRSTGGRTAVHRLRVLRVSGAAASDAVPSASARCVADALDLTGDVLGGRGATPADWTDASRRCRPGA